MNKVKQIKRLIEETLSLDDQVELLQSISMNTLTGKELAGIVQLFQNQMIPVDAITPGSIDLVGTGGDGKNTFNISTTASFIAAAAGIKIAKHGNRSITSRCGSFDCLKALNIPIPKNAEQAQEQFNRFQITFLFAPYYHPAMKAFSEARKVLASKKIKTIFNLLGPLLNPAKVNRIAIGVYDKTFIIPFIEALKILDYNKAFVFHGDGYDEITLTGTTYYACLQNGKITQGELTPEKLGFPSCAPEDLLGGDIQSNTETTINILKDQIFGPKREVTLLNAATAIFVATDKLGLLEACEKSEKALKEQRAYQLLESLQRPH